MEILKQNLVDLEADHWKDIIGISVSVWTLLQMLSPVPTCYNFIKKQSVGDMIVTPYVVACTSCTLWFLYGNIIGDKAVMRVNLIGSSLQFCYSLCFYIYCTKKTRVRHQFAISVGVIFSAILYIFLEKDKKRLESVFGLLCCCVTILFFASPLENMHHVIKKWNSESLPRLLIFTTFVMSSQWTFYGYLINDPVIWVTNLLGTILSGSQLLMIIIIPKDSTWKLISNI